MKIKSLVRILLSIIGCFLLLILFANLWIYFTTKGQLFESYDQVPASDVALVLGTSPKLMSGGPNPFFYERMKVAAELYAKGKVKKILVSGDNATKYYNEPGKMYEALRKLGIPKEDITLDYAGFRTLDSIVRCKKIFGQNNIIIITQPFHSHRALFISNYYDMNAVALAETNIPDNFSYKVKIREHFARALAVWDLYVVHRGPKFLGPKEDLSL